MNGFRPLDFVLLGDERGLRLVLVNRRHLLLLPRLVLLHGHGARPNNERSENMTTKMTEKKSALVSPGIHIAPWVS